MKRYSTARRLDHCRELNEEEDDSDITTHQEYPQHSFARAGLGFQTIEGVQARDTRISGRAMKEELALCASMM